LRVQKHLYAEGPEVCQHIIVHPPGGIAGGDRLDIDVAVGAGAWAQLTSPGAAKWYRAAAPAFQQLRLRVEAGATLEWLPRKPSSTAPRRPSWAHASNSKAMHGCSIGT